MLKLDHTPPKIFQDVADFMAIGQPEVHGVPHQIPRITTVNLAIKLIDEEVNQELLPNLEKLRTFYSLELMATILDDIADSIYVITWAAVAFDLPLNAMWNEVQKANMAKFLLCPECKDRNADCDNCNGKGYIVLCNEFGKVQKPEGWKPPDHWRVLYEYWTAKTAITQPDYIGKEKHLGNLPNDDKGYIPGQNCENG